MRVINVRGWSFVVIALALLVHGLQPSGPSDLPGGLDSPVIAMDLAASPAEVHALVSTDQTLPRQWYWFLAADLGFIAAYGVLFFGLSAQMRTRKGRLDRVAGIIGIGAAVATAAFDVGENVAIGGALLGWDAAAGAIRAVSLIKWGLLGVVCLVMALRFRQKAPIDSEPKVALVAASLFYLITAAIAVAAQVWHPVLEQVAPSLSVAVLLHTCAMVMDPAGSR